MIVNGLVDTTSVDYQLLEARALLRGTPAAVLQGRRNFEALGRALGVVCLVDGCGEPAHGHGLCNRHYRRQRRSLPSLEARAVNRRAIQHPHVSTH